ncbi:MAG: hypothetical protein WA970_15165 [Gammaproteobacteria bacterium]
MTTIRVMAVFNGGSLLPEDRFINVFHFSDASATDAYAALAGPVRTRVAQFYTGSVGAGAIGQYISPYAQRNFTVTSYNLLLPEGQRVPTSETVTLPAVVTGGGLPEEVALCLTLNGAPPVNPRRRGRIYIGPLVDNPNVIVPSTAFIPARPNMTGTSLVFSLTTHAATLAAQNQAMKWCIFSQTPSPNLVPIVGGYVDNAFDSQRRRGPDPSLRNPWVANP